MKRALGEYERALGSDTLPAPSTALCRYDIFCVMKAKQQVRM
jgi:hypothetical protein